MRVGDPSHSLAGTPRHSLARHRASGLRPGRTFRHRARHGGGSDGAARHRGARLPCSSSDHDVRYMIPPHRSGAKFYSMGCADSIKGGGGGGGSVLCPTPTTTRTSSSCARDKYQGRKTRFRRTWLLGGSDQNSVLLGGARIPHLGSLPFALTAESRLSL